jgi:hypothetical protein
VRGGDGCAPVYGRAGGPKGLRYERPRAKIGDQNQPVAAAQASRGASLLPDVHPQIAFTI